MRDPTSVFDDLNALRQDGEQLKKQMKASNKRARSEETFARIPHDRGLRLYKKIDAAAWVILTPEPEAASAPAVAERARVIEIEFATGGRMRITGTVDARTVTALMKALAKGKRRR